MQKAAQKKIIFVIAINNAVCRLRIWCFPSNTRRFLDTLYGCSQCHLSCQHHQHIQMCYHNCLWYTCNQSIRLQPHYFICTRNTHSPVRHHHYQYERHTFHPSVRRICIILNFRFISTRLSHFFFLASFLSPSALSSAPLTPVQWASSLFFAVPTVRVYLSVRATSVLKNSYMSKRTISDFFCSLAFQAVLVAYVTKIILPFNAMDAIRDFYWPDRTRLQNLKHDLKKLQRRRVMYN